MGYGIQLHVWGERACFTRPEMKGERVSYDVMTPSAATGLLEAVYWKPAIRWVVDQIIVLNPIVFDAVRRNELGGKVPPRNVSLAMKGGVIDLHQYITEDRQQRATLLLKDVSYIIKAHFEIVEKKAGPEDTPEKHYNIAVRRMRTGQCFHQPFLGCREFPAHFRLLDAGEELPPSCYAKEEERDLGWMLSHIDYENDFTPSFFRAVMKRGVVEVPK